MRTVAERRQEFTRLRALPALLADAVRGLDPEQLRTPYREGGWSVAQVVHHVADSHLNAYLRMRLIAAEENPTLKPYDQEAWAMTPDAQSIRLAASLTLLRGLHGRWVQFLRELPRQAFSRTGFHPERGTVSIDDLLSSYAEHGDSHLRQITGLRQRRGW